jgi:PelA/Pel-15E family pectate lyase
MMKAIHFLCCCFGVLFFWSCAGSVAAQKTPDSGVKNYLELSWRKVATDMPEEWYGSADARKIADNVLFCQQNIGGWAKNKPYHHPLSKADSIEIIKTKAGVAATFDNGATITEMRFLAKVHAKTGDERYRNAFDKGLSYILEAQYPNGGWPQFYPFRQGRTVSYAAHITYNDNAMVNVMTLLKEIAEGGSEFAPLNIASEKKQSAMRAFQKGVDCILKTQIKINGRPTVWCAQHDAVTLLPANARAYELASFSGSESAGITLLLMNIKNPSKEIVEAVRGAVQWFEAHKIEGIRVKRETNGGSVNTVVVSDPNAPPLWARFYELDTGRPFFCDRDGVKKYSLAEIGPERRNGYSWYTNAPEKVLGKYGEWTKENE